jgi:hypothetical protein
VILLLLACHPAPPLPVDPATRFDAATAEAARGGPPLPGDASPLPPFRDVDRSVATYVGADTCVACHAGAAATWAASGHAHAMTALEARQRANDPRCFRCHVTGYGSPGGYPAPAALRAVGCDHAYGTLPATAAACVGCHSWENSPDFTWETYWPRVAHGR